MADETGCEYSERPVATTKGRLSLANVSFEATSYPIQVPCQIGLVSRLNDDAKGSKRLKDVSVVQSLGHRKPMRTKTGATTKNIRRIHILDTVQ